MNRHVRLAFIALSLAALSANAANEEAIAKARSAAQSWLALADYGNGAMSWQTAPSLFQTAGPHEEEAGALSK